MAKTKRVYKYGQCYKCPKCFTTFEVVAFLPQLFTGKINEDIVELRNVVTRKLVYAKPNELSTYDPEYTYCE